MKNLGAQFGEIVVQRLKALETTAFAAETAAGLPPDAIRNAIRSEKKAGPTLSRVEEICGALGLEIYIGPPRDPSPEPVIVDPASYAQVPMHDAWLSAGPGYSNGDTEVIGHLAFRRDWLTKIGISPGYARVARAKGESMAPGIGDGDLVLIDTARTVADIPSRSPKDSRSAPIFAFVLDGEARIKRLQHLAANSIALLSDNQMFGAEVIDPSSRQFELLGQVVWSGHVWR